MVINYTQLRDEILNDPTGKGYAAHVAAGSDHKVADILNAPGGGTVSRSIIPAHELIEAIVPADWAALTNAEKQRVEFVLGAGEVNIMGANTRAALAAAFGTGTQTRTNMLALQTRPGSRAEQLFGEGVFVRHEDVARALRG